MKFISHRGNIEGSIPELENTPSYVSRALNLGYDVEIDLWAQGHHLFLGHDFPKHEIKREFLNTSGLWIHCKNLECFNIVSNMSINFFYHNNDMAAITSKSYIWSITRIFSKYAVWMFPQLKCLLENSSKLFGICDDNIKHIKGLLV